MARGKRSDPGLYSEGLAEEVCMRMSMGETLTQICADPAMPQVNTVYGWRRMHPDFDVAFAKAREEQTHAWADQIVGMMDTAVPNRLEFDKDDPRVKRFEAGGKMVFEIDGQHLSHVKEMIATRKWVMSKIAPHHYGDKQMIHNTYGVEQKDDAELLADLSEALSKANLTPAQFIEMLMSKKGVTE